MQLKLIPHETCPTCGAVTVQESCRGHHCNGQGFEHRSFACGCELRWSPNFERLEVNTPCPKHPDEKNKVQKRQAAREAIHALVDTLDVDDDWKARLKRDIQFT